MPTILKTRALGATMRETTVRVTFADFKAASLNESIALLTAKTDAVLLACWMDVREAFASAGAHSAFGLEVGSTGDPNSLLLSTALFGASVARFRSSGGPAEAYSGLAVKAKATSDVNLGDGTTPALNAGIVDVTFLYTVTR